MIILAPDHLDRIRAEAEATWPEECCGLLIGSEAPAGRITVEHIVPSPNVAEGDRRTRFEVSPQVLFDTMREIRGTASRIIGHYHSHPGHTPVPSAFDQERAWEPDRVWLIVGVEETADGPRSGEIRAWRPTPGGNGFDALALETKA